MELTSGNCSASPQKTRSAPRWHGIIMTCSHYAAEILHGHLKEVQGGKLRVMGGYQVFVPYPSIGPPSGGGGKVTCAAPSSSHKGWMVLGAVASGRMSIGCHFAHLGKPTCLP